MIEFKNNDAVITHTVYFFPNGNTAVCHGNTQVAELQASWLLLFVEWLEENQIDPTGCEFNLPNGMIARVFRTRDGGYNWEVVPGKPRRQGT